MQFVKKLAMGGQITPLGMPDKIASISGGGVSVHNGEITVVGTSTTSVTIQHGFSKIPFLCIVVPKDAINTSEKHVIGGVTTNLSALGITLPFPSALMKVGWWTDDTHPRGYQEFQGVTYLRNVTSSSFDLTSSASYPILETTYIWKAFALE